MNSKTKTILNAIGLCLYWPIFLLWAVFKGPSHVQYYFYNKFDFVRFCLDVTIGLVYPCLLILGTQAFFRNKSAWRIHLPIIALIMLPVCAAAVEATYVTFWTQQASSDKEDRCWYFLLGDTDVWNGPHYTDALPVCRQLAEDGSALAQFALGTAYQGGKYVKRDLVEATKWYRKAADQNYPEAFERLGALYDGNRNSGLPENLSEALSLYKKGADLEDEHAMFALSALYEKGRGVPQDYKEAYFWQLLAELKNFQFSDLSAGEAGEHLSQDEISKVIQRVSAAQMNFGLRRSAEQDYKGARWWYQHAADLGNSDAYLRLGMMSEDGQGALQSFSSAAMWYTKAGTQGNAEGQWNLGRLYITGQGIKQDYAEAFFWLTLSQRSGHKDTDELISRAKSHLTQQQVESVSKRIEGWKPEPFQAPLSSVATYKAKALAGEFYFMNYVGRIYREGIDVKIDYDESLKWYGLSLSKTSPEEEKRLRGQNKGKIDETYFSNLKIYHQVAQQGISGTQFKLGIQYLDGQNVPQSYETAYFWFSLAVKFNPFNEPEYIKKRDEAASHLTPKQIDDVKTRVVQWKPPA